MAGWKTSDFVVLNTSQQQILVCLPALWQKHAAYSSTYSALCWMNTSHLRLGLCEDVWEGTSWVH